AAFPRPPARSAAARWRPPPRRSAFCDALFDAFRAQLLRDARRAEFPRQRMRARLRVALVRELLALREIVEQRLEVIFRQDVRPQLARQLGAGVLAPREEPQGPLAQRGIVH